jgi:MFS family permease
MLIRPPIRQPDRHRAMSGGQSEAPGQTATLVVIGAGSLLFTCFGTAYAIPVFFPVLSEALEIPGWHLTALFSATGALYFSLGLVSGPIADRIGARTVVVVGSGVVCAGRVSCFESEKPAAMRVDRDES